MHLLQHSLMGVLELRDLLETTESPEKEVLWVLRGPRESLGYLASTDKKGTLGNEDRRANQGSPPLYQVGSWSKAFVMSVLRFLLLEMLCVAGIGERSLWSEIFFFWITLNFYRFTQKLLVYYFFHHHPPNCICHVESCTYNTVYKNLANLDLYSIYAS